MTDDSLNRKKKEEFVFPPCLSIAFRTNRSRILCWRKIPETNKPRAFSPIYSSTFLQGNSYNGDITFQVFLSCFLSTSYTCRIDFSSPSALTIWREAPHSTSLKLSSLSLGRHFLPSNPMSCGEERRRRRRDLINKIRKAESETGGRLPFPILFDFDSIPIMFALTTIGASYEIRGLVHL